MAGSSHSCTLRTPPSRPITHCVHMCTHRACTAYAVRTPHSRSTSSLPKPPPTRPRQSLQGLPMTIHSSRMGCRYVLYSRSVRFAWAPSSARKVKLRQAGCVHAYAACVRFFRAAEAMPAGVQAEESFTKGLQINLDAREVFTRFSKIVWRAPPCGTDDAKAKLLS